MRFLVGLAALTLCVGAASAHTRLHHHHSPLLASHVPNVGTASTYGYHDNTAGHPTATGAHFNPSLLTAAHPTLPMGTRVLVHSMASGRSVVVQINDRGPAAWTHRIIDLSTAAAVRLGMGVQGLAKVVVKVLHS